MEVLDLNMNAGDDTVTAGAGLDALGFKLDVDGGDGNDTIDSGDAGDLLSGGNGDDRITPDDNPAPRTPSSATTRVVTRATTRSSGTAATTTTASTRRPGLDTIQVNGATASRAFTVKPGPNGRVIFDRALRPRPPGLFNIDAGAMEVLDEHERRR